MFDMNLTVNIMYQSCRDSLHEEEDHLDLHWVSMAPALPVSNTEQDRQGCCSAIDSTLSQHTTLLNIMYI